MAESSSWDGKASFYPDVWYEKDREFMVKYRAFLVSEGLDFDDMRTHLMTSKTTQSQLPVPEPSPRIDTDWLMIQDKQINLERVRGDRDDI